ncbi:c2 domain-containing protein [Anaeramoeba flamelloides]|uniref:C2 domain-containing protein n=1 Tax=Anaeramoeba flamelloides TaxID=1746091 RepID=A0ABQ8YLR9_9EUKA|nr:c2 domain-containing protein [Anaeramoeba flamelloides]
MNDKTLKSEINVSYEVVNQIQKGFVLFDLREITKQPIDEDNLIVYRVVNERPSQYIGGYNKLRNYIKDEFGVTYPDHLEEITKEDFERQENAKKNLRKLMRRTKLFGKQKIKNVIEKNYLLIIRPIKGTNMPKMDRFGECDTYLKISILNSLHKPLHSEVSKKTFNPKWSVKDPLLYFILSKEEIIDLKVKVDIYDKDLMTSSKFGSFTFNVDKKLFPLGLTCKQSFEVKVFKKNKKHLSGDTLIYLDITLLDESIEIPPLPEEK